MRTLSPAALQEKLLERHPHRPTEDVRLQEYDKLDKGATIPTTVINLLKNMVGAGLLNVCVAFKYSSVIGGVLSMALSAVLCTCGFLLIGYCCAKTGARSFRALMCMTVGRSMGRVVDIFLFFHTLFSCVGYITLIADFTTKSCSGLFPGSLFAESRVAGVLTIVITILFPLSLLRDLAPLKYTSAFGLAVIFFACCYVFIDCFATAEEHHPVQNLQDHMWYMKFDTFKTIALFNGSFSAHYNAPTYYAELRNKSFKRYAQVTFWAFGISTVLFTSFGLIGFARFGADVQGNVLKSYDPGSVWVQLSWMCMNLATVFVFPLAFQRMRASWTALFNKNFGVHSVGPIPYTTIALLAVSTYFGVAFTDIAVIKMIKGATLGVSIMFIFPGLAYLGMIAKASSGNGIHMDVTLRDEVGMSRQVSESIELMSGENSTVKIFSYVLIVVGICQGVFALLSHYKLI